MTAERELARELGPEGVLPGDTREYLTDATEARQLVGHADAIALPGDPHQVATVMGWCYEHDVPLVPRGGGTGWPAARSRPAASCSASNGCERCALSNLTFGEHTWTPA